MGTRNWHGLDHICNAILEVEELTYVHAEISENGRKHLIRE